MTTPRRFPTLLQLEQREGALFTVLGNLTKRPYWFHLEYLKSPKAVRLEAWLMEAIFGEWVPEGWPMRSFPLLSPGQASPLALATIQSCLPPAVFSSQIPPLTASLLPAQAGEESTSRTSSVCRRLCFTLISGTPRARLRS